jgi:hypothetical protein
MLGVDGRIILKWILRKEDRRVWSGLFCSGYKPLAGCCEHGTEPSGSIKMGNF